MAILRKLNQTYAKGVLLHFNKLFLVQGQRPLDFFLNYNLFNNPYPQPSCCIGTGIDSILDKYIS